MVRHVLSTGRIGWMDTAYRSTVVLVLCLATVVGCSSHDSGKRPNETDFDIAKVRVVPDPFALKQVLRGHGVTPEAYLRKVLDCEEEQLKIWATGGAAHIVWTAVTRTPPECRTAREEMTRRVKEASAVSTRNPQKIPHRALRRLQRKASGLLLFDLRILGTWEGSSLSPNQWKRAVLKQNDYQGSAPESDTLSAARRPGTGFPFGVSPQEVLLPLLLLIAVAVGAGLFLFRARRRERRKRQVQSKFAQASSFGKKAAVTIAAIAALAVLASPPGALAQSAPCSPVRAFVDVSKSNFEESIPVARKLVVDRAARGCATEVVAFGDSVFAAQAVSTAREFDELAGTLPRTEHTALGAALCQTARQARQDSSTTFVFISDFLSSPPAGGADTANCDVSPISGSPAEAEGSGPQGRGFLGAASGANLRFWGAALGAFLLGGLIAFVYLKWQLLPRRLAETEAKQRQRIRKQFAVDVALDEKTVAKPTLSDLRQGPVAIVDDSVLSAVPTDGGPLPLDRLTLQAEEGEEAPRLRLALSRG